MSKRAASCLSLWERWLSEAKTERVDKACKALSVTFGGSSPGGRAKYPLLPLPLGEVDERSEDGEGKL